MFGQLSETGEKVKKLGIRQQLLLTAIRLQAERHGNTLVQSSSLAELKYIHYSV
jgi:hypothetical protein